MKKPKTPCEQLEHDIRNATIGMWACAAAIFCLFCWLFLWETPVKHIETYNQYFEDDRP